MTNIFKYIFELAGNFSGDMDGMTKSVKRFVNDVKDATSGIGDMASSFAKFSLAGDYFAKLDSTFKSLGASGISLDSQLHDLSAIAGVAGDDLKKIEGYARESAKAFGVDASQAVESYKLLLSQLSPELAKSPEALQAMGDSVATTSKLMGGDATAAAQVLTTAMNQYGVSLDDPMKASKEMARMMNVMAAAGQAGSAELPAIAAALSQCGMAAKSANISFEETNAAIQVLDKAGKKGSEGGVALRNVMTTLAKGRFLPKDTQKELLAAGIDVELLGDKTKPLKERLESLKPVLNDDALLSKFFGRENANAARALIQGTDALQNFTDAVTDTTSAEDQAAIIMDSYQEKAARIHQKMEDLKISMFEATDGISLWVGGIGEALIPISQLIPLITSLGSGFKMFGKIAFAACKLVGSAISSIPLVGWIALAITALAALIAYFWKTSAKFRAILKGIWAAIKAFFSGIKDLAVNVFGAIGDLFTALFKFDGKGIKEAVAKLKGGFTDFGESIGTSFHDAYNKEMEESAKREQEENGEGEGAPAADGSSPQATGEGDAPGIPAPAMSTGSVDPTGGSLSGLGESAMSGSGTIRNVTISVDKLVERFEINTTNLAGDMSRVKDMVAEALLGALNDVNLAV